MKRQIISIYVGDVTGLRMVAGEQKVSDLTPDRIGPDRAAKLREWADARGISRPHFMNTARKYHGVSTLADLTEEQARALFTLKW